MQSSNKELELYKKKLYATSLLLLMVVIFIGALIFETQYPQVGFIRAFSEAAMVGALVDWFAVTALFRYPLGLKIPHTAIIPNRKQLIAKNFGYFVREKFLSTDTVSDTLRSKDVTRKAAQWLIEPQNSERVAIQVVDVIAATVKILKDEDIQQLIEQGLATQIRSKPVAPTLGKVLFLVVSGNRGQEIFYGLIKLLTDFLQDNRDTIQKKINNELPWYVPRGVDKTIYQSLVEAVENTLQEVASNPNHPLYESFNDNLQRKVEALKNSPDIATKEEEFKEELLLHPVFQEFVSTLWADTKAQLIEYNPKSSQNHKSIEKMLTNFGYALLDDPELLKKVDGWVKEGTIYLVHTYGYEIENLISDTIDRWDTEKTSREIELQIGADLQYIRINGTIVGGLVGLVIYTVSLLVKSLI
ncbi:MAG: DUF445 domain-containing protein [Anaerolineae bacterium]